jgi:hypothetical protein
MKKTSFAVMLILSIILSLLAIGFWNGILVKGNIWPITHIAITFPENDKIYYSSTLTMWYHVGFAVEHKWIVYSLDGGEEVTLCDEYGSPFEYDGSVVLSGLSAGQHRLDIIAKNASAISGEWQDSVDTIFFNVFTSPSEYYVSIVSPQNRSSYSGPVLLNFTRFGHFPTLYNYLYAVDGQSGTYVGGENIRHMESEPLTGDITDWWYSECTTWGWTYLPDLSEGAHKLTFHSLRRGEVSGDFQTVYFNINSESDITSSPIPTSTPEATPTIIPNACNETQLEQVISGVTVTVAVIGAGLGLLIYLIKRK